LQRGGRLISLLSQTRLVALVGSFSAPRRASADIWRGSRNHGWADRSAVLRPMPDSANYPAPRGDLD